MPQLAPRFPLFDCTLLRTRSRLQSDCSIPNKIRPRVPTRIRTPTLPLEASLMLIVPRVELCPGSSKKRCLNTQGGSDRSVSDELPRMAGFSIVSLPGMSRGATCHVVWGV
ncbi:hypothetical protein Adt_24470 [Abeliophyllum distichum]|uniref:Uncharacterized protein n=1 Tax=Abeliophyllum distichum TaxID=126358 RepID=A0ABD1SE14_9LAMI